MVYDGLLHEVGATASAAAFSNGEPRRSTARAGDEFVEELPFQETETDEFFGEGRRTGHSSCVGIGDGLTKGRIPSRLHVPGAHSEPGEERCSQVSRR